MDNVGPRLGGGGDGVNSAIILHGRCCVEVTLYSVSSQMDVLKHVHSSGKDLF